MRYTDDDLRRELERLITERGSLRALARELGLSPTFLSIVRLGRVPPGPRLADALGFHDDGLKWVRHPPGSHGGRPRSNKR
jgi:hypothetical protein